MSTLSHKTGKLPPQSKLQGDQYIVIGLAGRGGMGAVYEALDTGSWRHRRVAIKEMSQSQLTSHTEFVRAERRFRREAAMLGSLDHPNLPRVYDAFEEQGRSYLVMDFIEGQTLLQMLQASPGRPLPLEKVLCYACQLCDVLGYLHRQYPPVIFRDLKPSNVMVTTREQIFLIDFGIARHFKEGQHQDTEPFSSLGFTAPEQYRPTQTDARSDLYSLGATLHCCLTARDPTSNKPTPFDFPLLRQYAPHVPDELEQLVQRLVEKDERLRPKSAEAVRQELVTIIEASEELKRHLAQLVSVPQSIQRQQPIRLPGDASGAPSDNETFSLNRPPPPEIWPEWMMELAGACGAFATWRSVVVIPWMQSLLRRTGHSVLDLSSANRRQRVVDGGKHFIRNLPKVSPVGIRKGFSRIGHGVLGGYENVELLLSGLSSSVLTPLFIILLFLRLAFITVGSIYVFHAFNDSYSIAAFCLLFLLLIIAGTASINTKIRDPIARNILFCTAFAISIAGFALLAFPDLQKALHAITVSQLLSIALITTAFVSLVRTTDRLAWVDHAAVIVIASTCALLQYTLGSSELLQIPIPGLTVDTSQPIIIVLTALLALIAFISLCRAASSFSKVDRVMVFGVALIYACMQFAFGYEELQHLPLLTAGLDGSPSTLLNVAYVYLALLVTPLLAALIALFVGQRWAPLSRVAIFVLAFSCALLQSFLAQKVKISHSPPIYPLMMKVIDLFTFNQIFIYGGLFVAGLLLLMRLVRKIWWVERPAIFVLAIVCVLLQSSFWSGEVQQIRLPSSGGRSSGSNWISLIALNQLFADALLLLVASGVVMAIAILLVRVARQNIWIDRKAKTVENRFTWVHGAEKLVARMIIFGILLVSTLLVAFFGGQGQILSLSIEMVAATSVSIGEIFLPVLILFTLIALFRMLRPFNPWDGFMLFVAVIACTLLTLGNTSVQYISPPIFSAIQQFMGNLLQGPFPHLLLVVGLFASATISLFWLKRTPARDRILRIVLSVLLGSTILCTFFQILWPVLLVVALFLLIHGTFIAIQMERVR